jgi:GTPase SAR1 family protein
MHPEKAMNPIYIPTTGARYVSKEILIKKTIARLAVWDRGYEPRLDGLLPELYSTAAVMIYVVEASTFANVDCSDRWKIEKTALAKINNLKPRCILVANKMDKLDKDKRESTEREIREFAMTNGFVDVAFTSANDQHSVEQLFERINLHIAEMFEIKDMQEIVRDHCKSRIVEKIDAMEVSNKAATRKSNDKKAVLRKAAEYLNGDCDLTALTACMRDHSEWNKAAGTFLFQSRSKTYQLINAAVSAKGEDLAAALKK